MLNFIRAFRMGIVAGLFCLLLVRPAFAQTEDDGDYSTPTVSSDIAAPAPDLASTDIPDNSAVDAGVEANFDSELKGDNEAGVSIDDAANEQALTSLMDEARTNPEAFVERVHQALGNEDMTQLLNNPEQDAQFLSRLGIHIDEGDPFAEGDGPHLPTDIGGGSHGSLDIGENLSLPDLKSQQVTENINDTAAPEDAASYSQEKVVGPGVTVVTFNKPGTVPATDNNDETAVPGDAESNSQEKVVGPGVTVVTFNKPGTVPATDNNDDTAAPGDTESNSQVMNKTGYQSNAQPLTPNNNSNEENQLNYLLSNKEEHPNDVFAPYKYSPDDLGSQNNELSDDSGEIKTGVQLKTGLLDVKATRNTSGDTEIEGKVAGTGVSVKYNNQSGISEIGGSVDGLGVLVKNDKNNGLAICANLSEEAADVSAGIQACYNLNNKTISINAEWEVSGFPTPAQPNVGLVGGSLPLLTIPVTTQNNSGSDDPCD